MLLACLSPTTRPHNTHHPQAVPFFPSIAHSPWGSSLSVAVCLGRSLWAAFFAQTRSQEWVLDKITACDWLSGLNGKCGTDGRYTTMGGGRLAITRLSGLCCIKHVGSSCLLVEIKVVEIGCMYIRVCSRLFCKSIKRWYYIF